MITAMIASSEGERNADMTGGMSVGSIVGMITAHIRLLPQILNSCAITTTVLTNAPTSTTTDMEPHRTTHSMLLPTMHIHLPSILPNNLSMLHHTTIPYQHQRVM